MAHEISGKKDSYTVSHQASAPLWATTVGGEQSANNCS